MGVGGKAWPLEYLKKAVATEKGEHHSDVNAQACENARTRHATSQSCGSWSAECIQHRWPPDDDAADVDMATVPDAARTGPD